MNEHFATSHQKNKMPGIRSCHSKPASQGAKKNTQNSVLLSISVEKQEENPTQFVLRNIEGFLVLKEL